VCIAGVALGVSAIAEIPFRLPQDVPWLYARHPGLSIHAARPPNQENAMSDQLKDNLVSRNLWARALYMLLFAIIYSVAEIVFFAMVIIQFLIALFSGAPNPRLLDFAEGLTAFIYQILRFLSFGSEDKPYPFRDWPKGPPAERV
jgi:hypothetical protein